MEWAAGCTACCAIVSIAPAIAALIIGAEYDSSSPCNDSDNYTIDLKNYLLIAGGFVVGLMGLFCIVCCCSIIFKIKYDGYNLQPFMTIVPCWILTFHFAWACIGFNMYASEMSRECQQEPIGQMIFAWSIIMVICTGPALVLSCCFALQNGALEDLI